MCPQNMNVHTFHLIYENGMNQSSSSTSLERMKMWIRNKNSTALLIFKNKIKIKIKIGFQLSKNFKLLLFCNELAMKQLQRELTKPTPCAPHFHLILYLDFLFLFENAKVVAIWHPLEILKMASCCVK